MTVDTLRHFPLPMLPDSWDLNPIFLQKLDELHRMWDEAGYAWKWGLELEFSLKTVAEADEELVTTLAAPHSRAIYPEYVLQETSRDNTSAAADTPDMYGYALEQMRQYFTDNPDSDILMRQTKWNHGDVSRHLQDFENNLHSEDPKIIHRARQNIFLAWLHTRDYADGGLRDLAEPRFGDHELGLGWYDMEGPEIRTRICDHADQVIDHYHKFLNVLYRQTARFGLVLDITRSAPPQFHMSIWRKSDNKNMMLMNDPESVMFCKRALHGYAELISLAPFMLPDPSIHQEQLIMDFSSGSRRQDMVRQEPDNWEIRRIGYHGVTHAARHLMLAMMGTAYGCLYEGAYERFAKDDLFLKPFPATHPAIRHRHGEYITGIAATLEHCTVDEDGYLKPDSDTIKNYFTRLKNEVGIQNLGAFSISSPKDPETVYDLKHSATWEILFGKIRLREDNTLDLDFLGPDSDIAEAFAAIEVTGRRTVIHTRPDHLCTGMHSMEPVMECFMNSRAGSIFFTPYEQSELFRHYTKQAENIMRLRAAHDVDLFEKFCVNNDNIPHATLAAEFNGQIYIQPTASIDVNASLLELVMAMMDGEIKLPRESILKLPSYAVSMRPHFMTAASNRIAELSLHKPSTQDKIDALTVCASHVAGKPFRIDDAVMLNLDSFLETLADGRLLKHGGLTPATIESACYVPVVSLLRGVLLAYRDNTFSSDDICRETDSLFRALPSYLEKQARVHRIDEKDDLTQLLWRMCGDHTLQMSQKMRNWIYKSLGKDPGLALPGPAKQNGPAFKASPF